MENRRRSRLAIDEEVVPISRPTGETNFALSETARQAGSGRLVWRDSWSTTPVFTRTSRCGSTGTTP